MKKRLFLSFGGFFKDPALQKRSRSFSACASSPFFQIPVLNEVTAGLGTRLRAGAGDWFGNVFFLKENVVREKTWK